MWASGTKPLNLICLLRREKPSSLVLSVDALLPISLARAPQILFACTGGVYGETSKTTFIVVILVFQQWVLMAMNRRQALEMLPCTFGSTRININKTHNTPKKVYHRQDRPLRPLPQDYRPKLQYHLVIFPICQVSRPIDRWMTKVHLPGAE
jgi:hypothetical protein